MGASSSSGNERILRAAEERPKATGGNHRSLNELARALQRNAYYDHIYPGVHATSTWQYRDESDGILDVREDQQIKPRILLNRSSSLGWV